MPMGGCSRGYSHGKLSKYSAISRASPDFRPSRMAFGMGRFAGCFLVKQHSLAYCRGIGAVDLFTQIESKRREVVEIELFFLVVAEDQHHVRLGLLDLLAEASEVAHHPLVLLLV